MSDTKFVPVITDDLDSFAVANGQIAIDVNSNKIAVDVNDERFVVLDEPKIKGYVKGKANQSDLDETNTNVLLLKVGKQDKLTAGENITITEDNVISATGGGSSITIDKEIKDSTHPVENSAIYHALQNKVDNTQLAYYLDKATVASEGLTLPKLILAGTTFYKDEYGFLTFSAPAMYDGTHSQLLNYEALEKAIEKLVGDAPQTLDTIEKLAAALKSTEGGVDKVIAAINEAMTTKANRSELNTVAYTGNYEQLVNTPTIPSSSTPVSYWVNDGTYVTPTDPIFNELASKAYVDSKVMTIFKYKGAVETYEDLPETANDNDFYLVRQAHGEYPENMTYIWNDAKWNPFLPLGTSGTKTSIEHVESLPVTDIELDKLYQMTTRVSETTAYMLYEGYLLKNGTPESLEEEKITINRTPVTNWDVVSIKPLVEYDETEESYNVTINLYTKDKQVYYYNNGTEDADRLLFDKYHPAVAGAVVLKEDTFMEQLREIYGNYFNMFGMTEVTSEPIRFLTMEGSVGDHTATLNFYIVATEEGEINTYVESDDCSEEELEAINDTIEGYGIADPEIMYEEIGLAIPYNRVEFNIDAFEELVSVDSVEIVDEDIFLMGSDEELWLLYGGKVASEEQVCAADPIAKDKELEVRELLVKESLDNHTHILDFTPDGSTTSEPLYNYNIGKFTNEPYIGEPYLTDRYIICQDYPEIERIRNLPVVICAPIGAISQQVFEYLGKTYVMKEVTTGRYAFVDADEKELPLFNFIYKNDKYLFFRNPNYNYEQGIKYFTAYPAATLDTSTPLMVNGSETTSFYVRTQDTGQSIYFSNYHPRLGLHTSGTQVNLTKMIPAVIKSASDPTPVSWYWQYDYCTNLTKVGDYYVCSSNNSYLYDTIKGNPPTNWELLDNRCCLASENTFVPLVQMILPKRLSELNSDGTFDCMRLPIGYGIYASYCDYETYAENSNERSYGTLKVVDDGLVYLYNSNYYFMKMWFQFDDMDHSEMYQYNENSWAKLINQTDIDKSSSSYVTTENFAKMLAKNNTFVYISSYEDLPSSSSADDTKIYVKYDWSSGSQYYHFNSKLYKYETFDSIVIVPSNYQSLESYFNAGNSRNLNKLYMLAESNYTLENTSTFPSGRVYSRWSQNELGRTGLPTSSGGLYPFSLQIAKANNNGYPDVTVDPTITYSGGADTICFNLVLTDSKYGEGITSISDWATRLKLWVYQGTGYSTSTYWTNITAGTEISISTTGGTIHGPMFKGFVESVNDIPTGDLNVKGNFWILYSGLNFTTSYTLWYLQNTSSNGAVKIIDTKSTITSDNFVISTDKYKDSDLPGSHNYTDIIENDKLYLYNKTDNTNYYLDNIQYYTASNNEFDVRSGYVTRGHLTGAPYTTYYPDGDSQLTLNGVVTYATYNKDTIYPTNQSWKYYAQHSYWSPVVYDTQAIHPGSGGGIPGYACYYFTFNKLEGKVLFQHPEITTADQEYYYLQWASKTNAAVCAPLIIDYDWYAEHESEIPVLSTSIPSSDGYSIANWTNYYNTTYTIMLYKVPGKVVQEHTFYYHDDLTTSPQVELWLKNTDTGAYTARCATHDSGRTWMDTVIAGTFWGFPFDLSSIDTWQPLYATKIKPLVNGALKICQHKIFTGVSALPCHSTENEHLMPAWFPINKGATTPTAIELDSSSPDEDKIFKLITAGVGTTFTALIFDRPTWSSNNIVVVISPATSKEDLLSHGTSISQWKQYYGSDNVEQTYFSASSYASKYHIYSNLSRYVDTNAQSSYENSRKYFVRKAMVCTLPVAARLTEDNTNTKFISLTKHIVARDIELGGVVPDYTTIKYYGEDVLDIKNKLTYYCCNNLDHKGIYFRKNLRWKGIDTATTQKPIIVESDNLNLDIDGTLTFNTTGLITATNKPTIHDIEITGYTSEYAQVVFRGRFILNTTTPITSYTAFRNLGASLSGVNGYIKYIKTESTGQVTYEGTGYLKDVTTDSAGVAWTLKLVDFTHGVDINFDIHDKYLTEIKDTIRS